MRVEEAELIFGKRWNYWTEEEVEEFVEVMEPSDMVFPIYLKLAVYYYNSLSLACRSHLAELGYLPS